MGFLDRFKKKTSEPPGGNLVRVPDGHEISIYEASIEPGVSRTPGGSVVASLGAAGDDSDRELFAVLRDVEAALRDSASLANFVNVNREMRLAELFAPADLEIFRFRSPVSWVFHRGSVASTIAEPHRLQALLRCMHRICRMEGAPIRQAVYLVDPPSPDILPFVRLIRGLGLPLKQPDAQEGGRLAILLEVKRPEGILLCGFSGKPYPVDDLADGYSRTINEEKDRAEAAANEDELRRLEQQERTALMERLGAVEATPPIVIRSPRLRKIILDLKDGAGGDGMAPLLAELRARNVPLLFMQHDGGVKVRNYGASGRALTVFADQRCLEWAAQDLGEEPGSFMIAGALPRNLIAMAAGDQLSLAIGTFRDRKTPVYAILPVSTVQEMANQTTGS